MPRRPRVFVQGGTYHVCYHFARGATILREADEVHRFLGLLHTVRYRDDLKNFAWWLMSNHLHLAVRAGAVAPKTCRAP